MPVIIVLALIAAFVLFVVIAVSVIGFALHVLFSPLLVVLGLGVLAWIWLRPRRARR
jgi:hypothetical protein